MGSKAKYAKEILPIILKDRKKDQLYVEPFCGGCNILDKVDGPRIGNDVHYYLIQMWLALQQGWIPPDVVSEELYQDVRIHKEAYPPALVGFIGFGCSYSGKWFGGYARGNTNDGKPRNYCAESRRNVLKQIPQLLGVKFLCGDYMQIDLPENSIIYCDIPYKDTTSYSNKFDHHIFWEWCRIKSNEGHIVFVSEYIAPSDFKYVWQKRVNNSLTANTGAKQGIERLWRYK